MRRFLTISLLFIIACSRDDTSILESSEPEHVVLSRHLNISPVPFSYSSFDVRPEIIGYFEEIQDNTPEDNPVTDWGATLGRALFYDKILSKNNTIACASCHHQKFGFSDTARLSLGFMGGTTKRHAMALANAKYYISGKFFWDERAETLEDQVLMPIQDEVEMGMTLPEVVDRLQKTEYYPILFQRAFGSDTINEKRMAKAMAQFIRSIVSGNSRFDDGLIASGGDVMAPFPNFTPSENQGKQIFYGHEKVQCGGCHFTRIVITGVPRNNGTNDNDPGVYAFNPHPQYQGAFKAPSLRNIAVRPPYMHNGSLTSLEEVIEHYNSGLENPNGNLDNHLMWNDEPVRMELTTEEKQALLDFLHTLTDDDFLTNPAYSNPFLP